MPVNPATLAKDRQACTPSPAKDAPTDAELQLALLLHHWDQLQPLHPHSPPRRALPHLVEARRRLGGDTVRLTTRLPSARKSYFPQARQWVKAKETLVCGDFLTRWPPLKPAQHARQTTRVAFCRAHNVRSPHVIAERLQAIKHATALTPAVGVIAPNQLLAHALVDQLRVLLPALERFDAELTPLSRALPDSPRFHSLPGAGPPLAPRLLAACGEPRARYRSAAELQHYAGIAPVTERRGQKTWGPWRLQCPAFLRQPFVEWAAEAIPRSFWAAASDRHQRHTGCSHQAAVRALAFTWLRLLSRCGQTCTPYDESRSLHALPRQGSPLLTQVANATSILLTLPLRA